MNNPAEGAISLFELNRLIKESINNNFSPNFWLVAEISEMNVNSSGHCYLELIEKATDSESIIARSRAIIWSATFRMLRPYFETTTAHAFTTGIKVLVLVSVEFHELYGLSLNIKDIEPSFTVGDLAKKKAEIIKRLQHEGVFELNQELEMPLVPQRIAIISSPTAAGYGDFVQHLEGNPFGFRFYCKLFKATMQGEETENSIVAALERIYAYESFFDLVVIIRGGGSQADLSWFNNYRIACNVAQFPLPVISGIGHERDETVVDLVAHTRVKTPTAAANRIIDIVASFNEHLEELQESFVGEVNNTLSMHRLILERLTAGFTPVVKRMVDNHKSKLRLESQRFSSSVSRYTQGRKVVLDNIKSRSLGLLSHYTILKKYELENFHRNLKSSATHFILAQKAKLAQLETGNNHLDPLNVLRRGYSITYHNQKALKNPNNVIEGEQIQTRLADGILTSIVKPADKDLYD